MQNSTCEATISAPFHQNLPPFVTLITEHTRTDGTLTLPFTSTMCEFMNVPDSTIPRFYPFRWRNRLKAAFIRTDPTHIYIPHAYQNLYCMYNIRWNYIFWCFMAVTWKLVCVTKQPVVLTFLTSGQCSVCACACVCLCLCLSYGVHEYSRYCCASACYLPFGGACGMRVFVFMIFGENHFETSGFIKWTKMKCA